MEKHLHHAECIEGMKILPNESVDTILTDPPYKYLKNQKLEVDFDETAFFSEVKRVLKKGGFIVLFGRGTSFYRWNYMLSELGFDFKEEIVWNKCLHSSPVLNLSRIHETISIHSKGKASINKVKIPYLEARDFEVNKVIGDIKRIRQVLNNPKSLDEVFSFIENYKENKNSSFGFGQSNDKRRELIAGGTKHRDRTVNTVNSFISGMNEKSIIKQVRDHYTSIHPTQKPVRLLERLLKLVLPQRSGRITIIDPFAGSFSSCEAVQNIALEFPENHFLFHGWEIDEQYYNDGCKRIGYIKNNFSTPLNF